MKPSITIKGSIVMNNKAWDKYQSEQSGFTPEELAILRPEYEAYRENCRKWWHWEHGDVMSFDDWCDAMADNAKEQREGK